MEKQPLTLLTSANVLDLDVCGKNCQIGIYLPKGVSRERPDTNSTNNGIISSEERQEVMLSIWWLNSTPRSNAQ